MKYELLLIESQGALQILVTAIIILIAVFILQILMKASANPKADSPHALGMPAGSVRAILAVSVLVLFVLVAVDLYLGPPERDEMAEKILTILGTLVIAVSSFYFGAKATQQGGEMASNIIRKAQTGNTSKEVPAEVILEAIELNRAEWTKRFQCSKISLAKKKAANTQFALNCILFCVPKKGGAFTGEAVPDFLQFISGDTEYRIPTDVEEDTTQPAPQNEVSLDDVNDLIDAEYDNWKARYDFLLVVAAMKEKSGTTTETPCVQFSVRQKTAQGKAQIPAYFSFRGKEIPSDVVEEDAISSDAGQIKPGYGSLRLGTTGTLGLKVFRTKPNGEIEYFALGCYHTFCAPELTDGKKWLTADSPSPHDTALFSGDQRLGEVVEGELNAQMDAALCRLDKPDSLQAQIDNFIGVPTGRTKTISNKDVQRKYPVALRGAESGDQFGTVKGFIHTPLSVEIDGRDYDFHNIIRTTKISVPGDSGAAVHDSYGAVVGLLFASSNKYSYVIPIASITIPFNIQICHA